jgi:hypothetical protein
LILCRPIRGFIAGGRTNPRFHRELLSAAPPVLNLQADFENTPSVIVKPIKAAKLFPTDRIA